MQVIDVLEEGISDGLHIGAQIYVSQGGSVVVDAAVGDARADVPMTVDTLMSWFSMTKAITTIAVAQQWEAGRLDIDADAVTFVGAAELDDAVDVEAVVEHADVGRVANRYPLVTLEAGRVR